MTGLPLPTERPDQFRTVLSATIIGLIVLVAALVGLNYFQGPKLEGATVDSGSITSAANQRIRFESNQSLAKVSDDQIRISPDATFTTSTSGTTLEIVLTEPLRFATDYTVTATDVTSRYVDQKTAFTHRFRTPPATVAFLDRADPAVEPGTQDAIREVTVPAGDPVTRYQAPGIQQFARVGSSLLVVTTSGAGGGAVDLVAEDGLSVERLLLPVDGEIGTLQSSTTVGLVAFTITSTIADPLEREQTVLYAVDLAGDHVVRPILGLGGEPLEVLESIVIPGGTSAAAQAPDESVIIVDLLGVAPAVPVGQFSSLRGVSPDGSQLLVGDIYSAITLSIGDGTEKRLVAAPFDGGQPFVGDIELVDQAGTRVVQLAVFDEEAGSFTSAVAFADDTITRLVYATPGDSGSIDDFTVSPNGQYVAIATVPDVTASIPDGAEVDPRSTSIVTTIVDVESGREVRTVSGFDLEW